MLALLSVDKEFVEREGRGGERKKKDLTELYALPAADPERTNSYLWLAYFIIVNLHSAAEPGSAAEAAKGG